MPHTKEIGLGHFDAYSYNSILLGESYNLSLNEAFAKFLSNLELTGNQTSTVSNRQNGLRDRLKSNVPYSIDTTLLIGSYPRYSQIRPLNSNEWEIDIDVLAILNGTSYELDKYFYNNDRGSLLLWDTEEAVRGYQGVDVKTDAPSVTASWKSLKMKVEITPAFRRKGGGYLIPNSNYYTNDWIETNPIRDAELLAERNKACNGDFKPLVKALKCFNRRIGKPISSFAIESFLYSTTNSYQGFYFELKWFLKKLLENDGKFIRPPSGVGKGVYLGISGYRYKIEGAIECIDRALTYDNLGQNRKAVEEMAKVFGSPFPLASTLSYWDFV